MIIVCPNCLTRFNLAESLLRPGVKLRCSVCKHVFVLPCLELEEEESQDGSVSGCGGIPPVADDGDDVASGAPESAGRSSSPWGVLFLLLLAAALAAGLWVTLRTPSAPTPAASAGDVESAVDPLSRIFRGLWQRWSANDVESAVDPLSQIVLEDVKQYRVRNERIGTMVVVEGKVRNTFDEPRALISVDVALYDSKGTRLVLRRQVAGNTLSLLQLQVLAESELEGALNDRMGIDLANSRVAKGKAVPFMVFIPRPADTAVEFGVKVASAQRVAD